MQKGFNQGPVLTEHLKFSSASQSVAATAPADTAKVLRDATRKLPTPEVHGVLFYLGHPPVISLDVFSGVWDGGWV